MTAKYEIRPVDGYRACPICSFGWMPSRIKGHMIVPIDEKELIESFQEALRSIVDQAFFHIGCFMRYLKENNNECFWKAGNYELARNTRVIVRIALDGFPSEEMELNDLQKSLNSNSQFLPRYIPRYQQSKMKMLKAFITVLIYYYKKKMNFNDIYSTFQNNLYREGYFEYFTDYQTFEEVFKLARNLILQISQKKTEDPEIRLFGLGPNDFNDAIQSINESIKQDFQESDKDEKLKSIVDENETLRKYKLMHEFYFLVLKSEKKAMQSRDRLALTHQELQGKMQNLKEGKVPKAVTCIYQNRRSIMTIMGVAIVAITYRVASSMFSKTS